MTAPRRLQLRRGNSTAVSTYTGAAGEVVIDTTNWILYVHDGSTVGGYATTTNVAGITGNITQANLGLKGYVDQANTIQSQQISAANLGMKGYVDSVASQSIYGNSNVKSYFTEGFDGNIIPSANVTYSLGSPTKQWRDLFVSNNTIYVGGVPLTIDATGNLTINGNTIPTVAYVNTAVANVTVDLSSYALNANVTAANLGLKGYVDQSNTIQSNQLASANLGIIGYVDNAVSTANVGLKGYVDQANSIQSSAISSANIAMKGYIDQQISDLIGGAPSVLDTLNEIAASINDDANVYTSLVNSIATANTALKGYVDQANTIQSSQLTSANLGIIGYVDLANTIQSQQISAANVGMKGYVDSLTYSNIQTAAYLTTATINTTGNITAGNLFTSGALYVANITTTGASGNISGANYITANYFVGNGALLTGLSSSYSNVQVATYLPTYDGVVTAGNVAVNGNVTAQYFLGNGALLTGIVGGAGNYGNIDVKAFLETDAGPADNFERKIEGYYSNIILGDTTKLFSFGNSSKSYFGHDGFANININYVRADNSDVRIATNNGDHNWTFSNGGNLTLPAGGRILESTYFSADSIRLKPNGGTSTQYLEIAPTAVDGNHVHLMTGSGTELFLGDDNHYVKLANTGGVVINSNDGIGNTAQWTFGKTGTTQFPGSKILAPAGESITMWSDNYSQLMWENANLTVAPNMAINSNFYVTDNNATLDIGYRDGSSTQIIKSWYWNADGNLKLPSGGYILNSDDSIYGGGGSYSNVEVAAYLNTQGYNLYSNVNVANYLTTATITTTGNITAQNLIGNISITGNVTGTSANVTLQAGSYSSTFDNQGNVRLPTAYVTGNVTANYFIGNGALLTGIAASSNYSNVNVATYLPTYSGNIANVRLGVAGVLTFADGTTQTTAGGGSYSNVQVAAYLTTGVNTAAPQIQLTNATSNYIRYSNVGVGAPTFTTSNVGTRIIYWPSVDATTADYAVGIDAGVLWHGIPRATSGFAFKWYAGNTQIAMLEGTGSFTIANIRLSPSGNIVFPDGTVQTTAATGSYSNIQVATYLPAYGGAIQSSNVQTTTANIQATTAATNPATGALRVMGGAGVAGAVFAGQLNTTGNLIANAISAYSLNTVANVVASVVNAGTINSAGNVLAQNLTGTLTTASQTNITAVGTLATLSVTGNATVGNLVGTEANTRIIANVYTTTFDIYGNVTFPGNLTVPNSVTVGGNLTVTGTVSGGTIAATVYLLEAYASETYTLPGSFTEDPCRYSVVSSNVNVSSAWFNTSTYTFTPQKAGYWEITAAYDVYRNTESSLAIKKNNSIVAAAGSFDAVAQQITKIIYLNGSTDSANVVNVGGAALSRSQYESRSWFQARWIGA